MLGLTLTWLVLGLAAPTLTLQEDPVCIARHAADLDLRLLSLHGKRLQVCPWKGTRGNFVTLGKGRSKFHRRHPGRTRNIERAVELLNGIRLLPGEEFSFNKRVGRRTAERGFELAPVFSGKAIGQGYGGGVCQVSSTLHVAALFGGMDIVERSPHSHIVKYVKLGLDAAVDWGRKDLRFRNPFPFPVTLRAEIESGREISIRLTGPMRLVSVRYYSEILEQAESNTVVFRKRDAFNTPLEVKGRPGVTVERTIRSRELLTGKPRLDEVSTDKYKPMPWVIAVKEYPGGRQLMENVPRSTISALLADPPVNVSSAGTRPPPSGTMGE